MFSSKSIIVLISLLSVFAIISAFVMFFGNVEKVENSGKIDVINEIEVGKILIKKIAYVDELANEKWRLINSHKLFSSIEGKFNLRENFFGTQSPSVIRSNQLFFDYNYFYNLLNPITSIGNNNTIKPGDNYYNGENEIANLTMKLFSDVIIDCVTQYISLSDIGIQWKGVCYPFKFQSTATLQVKEGEMYGQIRIDDASYFLMATKIDGIVQVNDVALNSFPAESSKPFAFPDVDPNRKIPSPVTPANMPAGDGYHKNRGVADVYQYRALTGNKKMGLIQKFNAEENKRNIHFYHPDYAVAYIYAGVQWDCSSSAYILYTSLVLDQLEDIWHIPYQFDYLYGLSYCFNSLHPSSDAMVDMVALKAANTADSLAVDVAQLIVIDPLLHESVGGVTTLICGDHYDRYSVVRYDCISTFTNLHEVATSMGITPADGACSTTERDIMATCQTCISQGMLGTCPARIALFSGVANNMMRRITAICPSCYVDGYYYNAYYDN